MDDTLVKLSEIETSFSQQEAGIQVDNAGKKRISRTGSIQSSPWRAILDFNNINNNEHQVKEEGQ